MNKCKNCSQELPINSQTCSHCNALVHTSPVEYFYTPTARLLFLYCFTLGVYTIYWFYKNWIAVKKASHSKKIYPFWRSLFSVLFCWSLFDRIQHDAETYGYRQQGSVTATLLFVSNSVLLLIIRISPYSPALIALIPIVVTLQLSALLVMQRTIKFYNEHAIPDYSTKRGLTRGELVFITVVCSWLAMSIGLGLFFVRLVS